MFTLAEIGERLRTQDNRCTADPIFEVQERKRVYGIDTEYDPPIAWLYGDESVEVPAEDSAIAEAYYDETGDEPACIEEGAAIAAEKGDDTLRRVGYHEYWEYVQPFFTEAAAELYIKQNGHNHTGELRIYAGSAFRNWEWQELRKHLISLTKPDVEPLYYIQDTRSVCGNSAFWWLPNGNGYTCNLNEAWRIGQVQADSGSWRETDILRLCSEIDALSARHFDTQHLVKR